MGHMVFNSISMRIRLNTMYECLGKTIGNKVEVCHCEDFLLGFSCMWRKSNLNGCKKNGRLMNQQYPRQSEQHGALERISNTLASGTKKRHLWDSRIFILWLSEQEKCIFFHGGSTYFSIVYGVMVAETTCFVILNFHLLERKGLDCGRAPFPESWEAWILIWLGVVHQNHQV